MILPTTTLGWMMVMMVGRKGISIRKKIDFLPENFTEFGRIRKSMLRRIQSALVRCFSLITITEVVCLLVPCWSDAPSSCTVHLFFCFLICCESRTVSGNEHRFVSEQAARRLIVWRNSISIRRTAQEAIPRIVQASLLLPPVPR